MTAAVSNEKRMKKTKENNKIISQSIAVTVRDWGLEDDLQIPAMLRCKEFSFMAAAQTGNQLNSVISDGKVIVFMPLTINRGKKEFAEGLCGMKSKTR